MAHLLRSKGLDGVIAIDSAGTGDWHVGEPPDARARQTAEKRGFPLSGRARQFQPRDFERFDYVVAMDSSNRARLEELAPNVEARGKIHMLRDFDEASSRGQDVPDPYYGGRGGFDEVFDLCEAACRGLLAHVLRDLRA
jgi:protein-tyrosine phosphatase